MFNILTDAIENAIDVADDLFSGNDLNKRKVAKLISDGLSVAAIASLTGVAVSTIQEMVKDDSKNRLDL